MQRVGGYLVAVVTSSLLSGSKQGSSCSPFAQPFTEYAHLRPLVHSVALEVKSSRPESRYLTETIPIPLLTLLPNLTRWSLSVGPSYVPKDAVKDTGSTAEGHGTQGVVDSMDLGMEPARYPPPPCHRMSLACLRRHSTTIQVLDLYSVTFPTSKDCVRFLLSFPALRSLRCEHVVPKTWQKVAETWTNQVVGRLHIRSLSVSA